MSRFQYQIILLVVILALAVYIAIPNSPGIHLGSTINKDFETRLGLDLVGGVQALLEADVDPNTPIDAEAMNTATSIVESRVNGLGVNEAVVQKAGDRRIVVELPGETDPERALAVLKKTGLLEFVDFSELTDEEIVLLQDRQIAIQTDYTPSGIAAPVAPTETISSTGSLTDTLNALTSKVFHTAMTGTALKTVQVNASTGEVAIEFTLTSEGTETFRDFTNAHVLDVLAITLDKVVISAPRIKNPITDGQGVIQGSFTVESANALAIQLRYGSLPVPLKVVESRTVGPTLGQDSLNKSMLAGIVGFVIVILFMGLFYRLAGLTADISIVIYALIAFAIFRFIPITLTLPGIAGFLLSTGSALDANILIFERLKEELRAGKTLAQAVDLGWKRALPSIRDANVATLITSVILFWFGNTLGATIVKGFSITLALGVLISLFTALIVTRILMRIVVNNLKSTDYAKWFGI